MLLPENIGRGAGGVRDGGKGQACNGLRSHLLSCISRLPLPFSLRQFLSRHPLNVFLPCLILVFWLIAMMLGMPVDGGMFSSSHSGGSSSGLVLPEREYVVYLDCGSSGTRVYVYTIDRTEMLLQQKQKWKKSTSSNDDDDSLVFPHIGQLTDSRTGGNVEKKIEPGLSSYVNDYGGAFESIKPLLHYAVEHIPEKFQRRARLYIHATAGMRALPAQHRDGIMMNIRQRLRTYPYFRVVNEESDIGVISGREEGMWSWAALNFLQKRLSTEALAQSRTRSLSLSGMLEMGGGSVQLIYPITATQAHELSPQYTARVSISKQSCNPGGRFHDQQKMPAIASGGQEQQDDSSSSSSSSSGGGGGEVVKVKRHHGSDGDKEIHLYVMSFLGYGANSVRKQYVQEELVKPFLSSQQNQSGATSTTTTTTTISDPCLLRGQTENVKTSDNREVHIVGSGDFQQCVTRLKQRLNPTQVCRRAPCSLGGVHQSPWNQRRLPFILLSEFWYTTHDILGMDSRHELSRTEFRERARAWCSRDFTHDVYPKWQKKEWPLAGEHRLRMQCFKSAWMLNILYSGFQFSSDLHPLPPESESASLESESSMTVATSASPSSSATSATTTSARQYQYLKPVSDIDGQDVEWTLGSLVMKAMAEQQGGC